MRGYLIMCKLRNNIDFTKNGSPAGNHGDGFPPPVQEQQDTELGAKTWNGRLGALLAHRRQKYLLFKSFSFVCFANIMVVSHMAFGTTTFLRRWLLSSKVPIITVSFSLKLFGQSYTR